MSDRPKELDNKVVILNGFTPDEITRLMRAVKSQFEKPSDIIFAMTTERSLNTRLMDLIVDMSRDHEYLKQNPPNRPKEPSQDE